MHRTLSQRIEINSDPENIYSALLSPSAIKDWWQATTAIVVKQNNGVYAVSWGLDIDDPDYVAISIIRDLVPPIKFSLEYSSYVSKTGKLPFEAKMIVSFNIIPKTKANTILEIKQTGIPVDQIADAYFESCKIGWNQVLIGIKNYCELV